MTAAMDPTIERKLGAVRGARPGPTLIVVASIHGNEHAGIAAARRVLARLARGDVRFHGDMVALVGNVSAARERRRYRTFDMNRVWTEARVARIDAESANLEGAVSVVAGFEGLEQRELLVEIREAMAAARGPIFMIDLHTTSAAGVPFVACGTSAEQFALIEGVPLPVIVGLESMVEGALTGYWNGRGLTAVTVEGGQHDDPGTIDNLEAVLHLVLEASGILPLDTLAEAREAERLLDSRRGDLPRTMEVLSRYAITEDQEFMMEPGFRNVDYARASQLLARDRNGDIRAETDGVVILPLYQGQGNDGFFWGRPIKASEHPSRRALPSDV